MTARESDQHGCKPFYLCADAIGLNLDRKAGDASYLRTLTVSLIQGSRQTSCSSTEDQAARVHAVQIKERTPMIAIDALVGRCITFLRRANGANTLLQQNFPESYSLDPSHAPHLTLWQSSPHSGEPAGISNVAKKSLTADSNTTSI